MKAPTNRKESNAWQNAKTGRWHWEGEFKQPNGTAYRRAGSRKLRRTLETPETPHMGIQPIARESGAMDGQNMGCNKS